MTGVMLFAAGRGTRMRELTADRPKPMIPVTSTTGLRFCGRICATAPAQ